MLQRFIAITLLTCVTGLLTACGDAVRSSSLNQLNPSPNPSPNLSSTTESPNTESPNTENILQLQLPTPPSAKMKNELKREKYQLRQDGEVLER